MIEISSNGFQRTAPASRVREIFAELLARSTPDERQACLAEACGVDQELRALLLSLLAAHEKVGSFLEPNPGFMGIEAPTAESLGQRIGRYKLLEKIGEGGCGTVYLAEQDEPIRRRVALKIIKLGMDTRSVIARFEAERQAVALMDHSNIAKVFDAGSTENGRPYFVMELVQGVKITDHCNRNHLSMRQRLELFVQVCGAVQHAHQKGIIHRDLKPSNVLVTAHDGVPIPKVIDFGIAKATSNQGLTERTVLTALQFLGTPAYMSPEQAEMSSLDVDTRSDIYSLGVLLYELLTGQTPFDTTQLLQAGFDEMRRIIREQEPVRPSTRLSTMIKGELAATAAQRQMDAPKLVHTVRGDLDWIVAKCLEKERIRRYETANGLAADLRRFLENEPVVARPPTTGYRMQKAFRRNRLAFISLGAVGVALLLGVIVSTRQAVRATRAEQVQHRNVVRQYVLNGTRLMNERDLFGSLPWFAEALRLDAGDPERERPHRIRIASVLRQAPRLLDVITQGHTLFDTELSTDGTRIVTASDDHTARIWQVNSGACLVTVHHDADVYGATLSPNGLRLLTTSRDHTARLWDAKTGALLHSWPHPDVVWSGCFSADGRRVATACQDGAARVWDSESGQQSGPPLQNGKPAVLVTFSPDQRLLAVRSTVGDGATIWEVATGQKRLDCADTVNRSGVEFSPDSECFLTGDGDQIHVWSARTFQELPFSPLHSEFDTVDLKFSPDGRTIAAAGGLQAMLWDARNGQPRFSPGVRHTGILTDIALSPDGQRFATAGNDAVVRQWSSHFGQPVAPALKLLRQGKPITFFPDARRLLVRSCDQAVRVWDMATADIRGAARPSTESELRLTTPDGGLALQFGPSNSVAVVEIESGKVLSRLPHTNEVTYASFSRDGKTVITASEEMNEKTSMRNNIFLWDARTGRRLDPGGMSHQFNLSYVAFNANSTRILTCGFDFTARLWDARNGAPLSASLQHRQRVSWGKFSPDGRAVLTASWDKIVRLWDAQDGTPLTPPLEHRAPVVGADWSLDGTRLITLTEDDEVQTWDVVQGEPLTPAVRLRGGPDVPVGPAVGHKRNSEDLPWDDRPVEDLVLLSRVLGIGRVSETGSLIPIELGELTTASSKLRAKYPLQFTTNPGEAAAWHAQQANDSRLDGHLTAALFQLDQALLIEPQNNQWGNERAKLAAQVDRSSHSSEIAIPIPDRDPACTRAELDLSSTYNSQLRKFDLPGLPPGRQRLGGVDFDVRGAIELSKTNSISAIRVGFQCSRFHFLQANVEDEAKGIEVGSYVVHYADGEVRKLPVVQGDDIGNWRFDGTPKINEGGSAVVVWTGVNKASARDVQGICLYKSTRLNPRPGVDVISLDFVSNRTKGGPFLLAATVD